MSETPDAKQQMEYVFGEVWAQADVIWSQLAEHLTPEQEKLWGEGFYGPMLEGILKMQDYIRAASPATPTGQINPEGLAIALRQHRHVGADHGAGCAEDIAELYRQAMPRFERPSNE
jgi:hypothetical protein